jgi:protein involved in polysaccharide export with SLBB domain
VLTEDSYSKNALKMQQAIAQAGGVKRAADIITQAIASKQPALSPLTSGASTDIRSASNAA